jgi:thiosulfate/3-mercaptopyruvate sulfurtransferase
VTDPIVSASRLDAAPRPVLVDVRWYADGRDGLAAYQARHLPGAVYVDLDTWLAGPPAAGGGRHPLPDPVTFAEGMSRAGIGDGVAVVAYDDAGGVVAARLVWMLRAVGVDAALLDGGLTAWVGPVEAGEGAAATPATFTARPWPDALLASLADVDAVAAGEDRSTVLLDARARERYEGAPDALDPRAGHIPGARSLPCRDSVGEDGRLLPEAAVRERLASAGVSADVAVISSCGSGVTACHTLLVMEHVGLPPGRLYVGSWSEWSRSDRPAATGPNPY